MVPSKTTKNKKNKKNDMVVIDRYDTPQSSNIKWLEYDGKDLRVAFKAGGVYLYYNVPETVYEMFQKVDSVGQYFWAQIRDKYKYTRLDPGKPKKIN